MRHPLLQPALIAVLLAALAACAPVQPRLGSAAAQWLPSPNFEPRRPNYVILHHTGDDNVAQALATLSQPLRGVSAHYLIGRDGRVLQLVDEKERAWHAGVSWWGGQTDMNSASIGIELDNNGAEPFPEAEIAALLELLADIQKRWNLPRSHFLGHADVAPGRKADPSAFFPWRRLAAAGFGLWCEPPYAPAPENFDAALGLTALGYDPARPEAAVAAFNLHFFGDDTSRKLRPEARDLLYCLLQQAAR
jgi:N-acetylmuramoyl-L-alanine amidase